MEERGKEMGFLDEVAAFTKGVGQKAKDNYDIVAMNSKISSLSKEIRSVYTQIGEKYCAMHKDGPEAALKDFVETVKSLEAQVAVIERQIESTKAAVSTPTSASTPSVDGEHGFCEKCGAPLLADSVFCVKCGARVTQDGGDIGPDAP